MKINDLDCISGPKNNWLNLWKMRYSHKGHDGTWFFVSRDKEPTLVHGQEIKADAITVIPAVMHSLGLVCIKEFRYPIGRYEYGFPAGLLEGKTLEQTVQNEVKEETGMTLRSIVSVSPPLLSSAGMSDETASYVLARVEGDLSSHEQERTEDIHPFICTVEMAKAICSRQGEFEGAAISSRAWPILSVFAKRGLSGVWDMFDVPDVPCNVPYK
jgi:ADP-ribose pyrophosphatase